MTNDKLILCILGIGSAVVAGLAWYNSKKAQDSAESIQNGFDDAINKIANGIGRVDISNTIIEEAVDRAVEKSVAVASASAISQVKNDILREVRKSVNEAYGDTKDAVAKELERQIGNVDISGIRKEAIAKARDAAQAKLASDMDDILKDYNNKLQSISKVYDSVADALANRNGPKKEGMTFTIGG